MNAVRIAAPAAATAAAVQPQRTEAARSGEDAPAPQRAGRPRWLPGNSSRLLINGEEYYPAVFEAIRRAQTEVLLETFIVFEDKIGLELHAVLLDAARRGVQVDVLVDGYGTADLSHDYVESLREAGVRLRAFDPSYRLCGVRLNMLRRMHRKIVVVDGAVAFVGGINYGVDHLDEFGAQAKQDYAVELHGPIAAEIRRFVRSQIRGHGERHQGLIAAVRALRERRRAERRARSEPPRGALAMLVTRDNHEHRDDIERHYRAAIRLARRQVIIANAYFFPGHRLLHALRAAARRGVDVRLVLQGEPDVPLARKAAMLLYGPLRSAGVHVHEYIKRPLHGKVAVIDDEWATVGSSNLDPLSLALNLEANVFLRDREFATQLRTHLEELIRTECVEVDDEPAPRWRWWAELRSFVVFHFLRRFPSWAGILPRHEPKLLPATGNGPAPWRGVRERAGAADEVYEAPRAGESCHAR